MSLQRKGVALGAKTEQKAHARRLRAEGATWPQVVAEFHQRWSFNARQTLRIACGLSQADVAAEWRRRWPDDTRTARNVSTWERWPAAGHMPSLVALDRLARIYRCSVADLVSDFHDYGRVNDDGVVDRRTLVAGLGSSLAGVVVPSLRPRRIAPELAEYFDTQLRSHYRADMLAGPHLVLDTVAAQYGAIRTAIEATTGELHAQLLRIATSYAALAGWLYQDAGNLADSMAWRSETLDMAHRSGDLHLVSYALTNKAMLCVEVGDGVGAVDLASAALSKRSKLVPKVQVLALVQSAHGAALTGDRYTVDTTLDEVAGLVDRVDDDWPWGNAFRRTPGYLDVQRATCYGRLGHAAASADMWAGVIDQQPDSYRRDSGVYLARHAGALADSGDVTSSTQRARQAVRCLHETGSARMRLELARLRDKAGRWGNTTAGHDLIDALTDVA